MAVRPARRSQVVSRAAPTSALRFSFRSRLPVLLQNEVAECGLACIAMIASYHGHRTTLTELRQRYCVSITGSTVRAISAIADGVGLTCRPLRTELRELKRVRPPAVLHWQLDHFVVLRSVRRGGIVVHDPARGKRVLSWNDASRFFTGVVVEMTPGSSFEKKDDVERVRIRDLWTKCTGLGVSLAQILLLSAMLQLFTLLTPLVNQLVVDEAIAKADGDFLIAILAGFALLLIAQTAVEALRASSAMYLGQILSFQLRSNLLKHVIALPVVFFEKRHIGDVVSRIGSLAPVEHLMTSAMVTMLLDGVLAIATFIVMFLYSPTLAVVVAGISLLGLAARTVAFPYVRRLTQEKVHSEAELQSVLLESIRAIRAIKLFGRESQRHAFWQNAFVDATNVGIQLQKLGIATNAGSRLMQGSMELAVFFIGAKAVMGGTMTLGMLFAFQAYRLQFTARVSELIGQLFVFRTAGVHLERLADLVHASVETGKPGAGLGSVLLCGEIELRGARLRYGDDQPWVLDGVDVRVEPGERVAIVGRSGCGKSTLLKALVGLHPLQEGELLYDGVPAMSLGVQQLRKQIGVVMQDDRLLSGTLADNIAFYDEEPDMDRIIEVANLTHIHAEIRTMPMGYHTLIGDMGSALSGGQKQRLLLARALYRKPRILFLDEGTANLDIRSEQLVLEALAKLDITQIIVAHRPAAVDACDRIIRLEKGRASDVVAETPSRQAKRTPSHL